MAKGRSISKISKELETLVDKMKKKAKEFAEADGAKKQKITGELKKMTFDKKMLEKELESSVAELDKNAQLQVDEVRKLIRNVIKEELKKKITEIEFEKPATTSGSSKGNTELDDVELTSDDEQAAEDALDKVFSNFEKVLNNTKTDIKKASQNESITTVLGIVAALPKIIEFIGKLVKGGPRMISILMGQGEMYGGMEKAEQLAIKLGAFIEHGGHALHEKYILAVKKFFRFADKGFREMDDKMQDAFAEKIWMAVVASLMITSGLDAAHAALDAHFGHAAVEGTLTAIKNGELKTYLQKELTRISTTSA
jgi:hypothetical protein